MPVIKRVFVLLFNLEMFMNLVANVVVDASGLNCPMPLLKMKMALNSLQSSEIVRLIATDPSSQRDILSFCDMSGHRLLSAQEESGCFIYFIEKS